MIESDTIKLLRECDSGIKMGVESIDDVIGHVSSQDLKGILLKCKSEHEKLDRELKENLDRYCDEGKEPNVIAEGMSKIKTGIMLKVSDTDETIADLMTDGANMGVKSLSKYLNKYAAADEKSKDICKRLIKLEDELARDIRLYL